MENDLIKNLPAPEDMNGAPEAMQNEDYESAEDQTPTAEIRLPKCERCGGDITHPAPDSGMLSGVCPADR